MTRQTRPFIDTMKPRYGKRLLTPDGVPALYWGTSGCTAGPRREAATAGGGPGSHRASGFELAHRLVCHFDVGDDLEAAWLHDRDRCEVPASTPRRNRSRQKTTAAVAVTSVCMARHSSAIAPFRRSATSPARCSATRLPPPR